MFAYVQVLVNFYFGTFIKERFISVRTVTLSGIQRNLDKIFKFLFICKQKSLAWIDIAQEMRNKKLYYLSDLTCVCSMYESYFTWIMSENCPKIPYVNNVYTYCIVGLMCSTQKTIFHIPCTCEFAEMFNLTAYLGIIMNQICMQVCIT